ncbi:membrane protein [Salmonella enterica subsp. enterica]|nr:membrane protein [Salmonella enterica subsp. enterica]
MFQNSGEVIMYFGCFLFSLPFILVLIRKCFLLSYNIIFFIATKQVSLLDCYLYMGLSSHT